MDTNDQEEINEIRKTAKVLHNMRIEISIQVGITESKVANNLGDHALENGAALPSMNNDVKITLKTAKKATLESAMEHWQKQQTYSETGIHLSNST